MNAPTTTLTSGRKKMYAVIRRNCAEAEPGFGVYESTLTGSANLVAWFFNQSDAEAYARWKNGLPAPTSRH